MAKILFVLTGADRWTLADGTEHPTGFWAEEAAVPYEAFTEAGHTVTMATPGGVLPPVDTGSLTPEATGGQAESDRFAGTLKRDEFHYPVKLEDVELTDYDAVFYPGGHGPMEDLSVNAASGRLLTRALAEGTPLGIVCHGPAAMLTATKPDGTNAFAGYRVTAFTNAEETQAGFASKAKWLLQDRLVQAGVDFQEGEPWTPHVETDRTLITGQNPASSAALAAEMLKRLP
ncbi:type 1 glutamine amidotransferase domain-containing protein [Spirillospora sp. NPDC052269]